MSDLAAIAFLAISFLFLTSLVIVPFYLIEKLL